MPVNLVDADWLNAQLPSHCPPVVCIPSVTSTNDVLKAALASGESAHILIANEQTQGRGRRGRTWLSPAGAGLYLSLPHHTHRPSNTLGALSVLLALSAATAIGGDVRIKWPNDLVIPHPGTWAKVGGCLIDVSITRDPPYPVILGLGLNLNLNQALHTSSITSPDQAWADLSTQDDPNTLTLKLITQIYTDLAEFEADGFEPFMPRWERLNVLHNTPIRVLMDDETALEGIAGGINAFGQLSLVNGEKTEWLSVGEVSIRPHQD